MAWAREPRRVPLTMPHVAVGSQGPRPVMPDEPAYAELGPHRPGRPRPRLVRHRSRPAGAALGAGDPRHRRQRQRHDRPRHQHLPGRRRRRTTNGRRSIPGPALADACRGDPRRRAGADHPHLRDPHPHRPLAGDGRPQGAHRRHRPRPGGAPSRMAGRDLRAGRDAARRRADRARAGHDAARRSTPRAMPRTTSATCSRKRRRSSPATT